MAIARTGDAPVGLRDDEARPLWLLHRSVLAERSSRWRAITALLGVATPLAA